MRAGAGAAGAAGVAGVGFKSTHVCVRACGWDVRTVADTRGACRV